MKENLIKNEKNIKELQLYRLQEWKEYYYRTHNIKEYISILKDIESLEAKNKTV